MDKYLESTKGLLGLMQATLGEKELERSNQASEEMWEAIKKITDQYQLSVQEMLNATLACHYSILDVVNEQLNEVKEGMEKE